MSNWHLVTLTGKEAAAYASEIAALRIKIFRDFPYLYEGELSYEMDYLKTYFSYEGSFIALCMVDKRIVGASTALPLEAAPEYTQKPFIENGYDVKNICYYGESVLLKEFRELGIGKSFMKAREDYARSLGKKMACFCAVIREDDHPLRSKEDSLEPFWKSFGFQKMNGMKASFNWKEIGKSEDEDHDMQFWGKELS